MFWEDRKYLYGLAELARLGLVDLCDSYELRAEQFVHPMARYRGKRTWFEEDIFDGVGVTNLDGFPELEVLKNPPEYWDRLQLEWDRRGGGMVLQANERHPEWLFPDLYRIHRTSSERIRNYGDPLHSELTRLLQGKTDKDAWHIVTAERHGMDCFMTMDYKLIRRLRQLRKNSLVRSLSVDVLTPSEWGQKWKLEPIQRPDLVGELAGRRQPNPYYRVPNPFFEPDESGIPRLDLEGWPFHDSSETSAPSEAAQESPN